MRDGALPQRRNRQWQVSARLAGLIKQHADALRVCDRTGKRRCIGKACQTPRPEAGLGEQRCAPWARFWAARLTRLPISAAFTSSAVCVQVPLL